MEVEVARSLVVVAVNESDRVARGSGSASTDRLAPRHSTESLLNVTRPSQLFTSPVNASPRHGGHPDSDRLLAKASVMLRLANLLLEAGGEAEPVLRHVPPFLARVFGAKTCTLALVSKLGRRLYTWVPAAPASPEPVLSPTAAAARLPPLERQPVPVNDEIIAAIQRVVRASEPLSAADKADGSSPGHGGTSPPQVAQQFSHIYSQQREHHFVLPLVVYGHAPHADGHAPPHPDAAAPTPTGAVAPTAAEAGSGAAVPAGAARLPPSPLPRLAHPHKAQAASPGAATASSGDTTPTTPTPGGRRRSRPTLGDPGSGSRSTLTASEDLSGGGRVLGVLLLRRRIAFSPAELDLLNSVGYQLSLALQRSRRPRPALARA